MVSGRQISKQFILEVVWPILQKELPDGCSRLAVAIIGTGSDVLGLDDSISRDHHWGPRANVMTLPEDKAELLPRVRRVLEQKLPSRYQEYEVNFDLRVMTGVCCCAIDDFFVHFLGTDKLPETELDWLKYCEVDLFHVTGGEVVIDGPGELSRRRAALQYYPENVWMKRVADWCMYITGRDAPYNLHRMNKRDDTLTARIYEGLYYKQAMELCFTLNRQYAPYTKWLNRLVRRLPKYGPEIAPRLEEIESEPELHEKVLKMIDVNYMIADALHELGLTEKFERREFDPSLTDLTLYDCAAQIYSKLPPEFLAPSFNRTELWERIAREVLFDSKDYFQKHKEGAAASAAS